MTLTSDEQPERKSSDHNMVVMTGVTETGTQSASVGSARSMDIVAALETTGHVVRVMSNGLIVGVCLHGMRDTRSVAVDIAYVLDLRDPTTNRTGLAVQSAVLSVVNRGVDALLHDVGLSVRVRRVRTIRGSVMLPVIGSRRSGRESMICVTRTAYVVYDGVRPSRDFSWFTKNERIVEASEFALIRRSDIRTNLNAIEHAVDREKWNYLVRSTSGWYGLIALTLSVLLLSKSIVPVMYSEGEFLVTAAVGIVSFIIGLQLVRVASRTFTQFIDRLRIETVRLDSLGDTNRLLAASKQNEQMFRLVTELNFLVSSLAADAASALVEGDLSRSVRSLSSVIDECVRVSPSIDSLPTMRSADEGLRRFMGLFRSLGAIASDEEEAALALAYVVLSGQSGHTLSEADVLRHMTTMNFVLYKAGLLNPSTKDTIDDMLNRYAAGLVVSTLTHSSEKRSAEMMTEATSSVHLTDAPAVSGGSLPSSDSDTPSSKEEMELIHDLSSSGDSDSQMISSGAGGSDSIAVVGRSEDMPETVEDVAGGAQEVISRHRAVRSRESSERRITRQDSARAGGEVESVGT